MDGGGVKNSGVFQANTWGAVVSGWHEATGCYINSNTATGGLDLEQRTAVTSNGSVGLNTAMATAQICRGGPLLGGATTSGCNNNNATIDFGEITAWSADDSASATHQPVEASIKSYWGTP